MLLKGFSICLFFFFSFTGWAQTLSGTVKTHQNEPIVGATIFLHEANLYQTSDGNGNFIFQNISPGKYHVDVTYVGFEAASVPVEIPQKKALTISLHQSTVKMRELVIEESTISSINENRARDIVVLSSGKLATSGSADVLETLSELPGVQLIKIGTTTSKPIIRGLGFNRTLTNVNGIKQESQQWGADHGLPIDQNTIENIELVKGANSLIYGSDALGGVLNIYQNNKLPSIGLHGKAGTRFNSATLMANPFGLVSYRKGKFFIQGSASYLQTADMQVPANNFRFNTFVFPIYNNQLKNTASNQYNFSGAAGFRAKWGQLKFNASTYQQQVGFFPGAHGRPNFNLLFDDGDRFDIDFPHQNIYHRDISAQADFYLAKGWLEIDAGFQQNTREELENPHPHKLGPIPDGNLALKLQLNTTSANVRYHFAPENGKTIVGASLQQQVNTQSGFEYFLPAFSSQSAGIFVYREKTIKPNLILNFGARADVLQQNISEKYLPSYSSNDVFLGDTLITRGRNNFFSNATGALGLVYHKNHFNTYKINLGSGFRFPTVPELTANGFHHGGFRYEIGNADLKPERTLALDASFSKHQQNFDFYFSPYVNYFLGYIFLSPTGKFSSRAQGGGQIHTYQQADALHSGFEVSFTYHFLKKLHLIAAADGVVGHNLETNRPLPFMPPPSANTTIAYDILQQSNKYELTATVGNRVFLPQQRVAINENVTDGSVIFNSSIQLKLKSNFVLNAGVNNIFNTQYLYHLSRFRLLNLPELGRNFNLTLNFSF